MLPQITNFKLGIGIPITWSHVPVPFFLSFILMERPDFELIYPREDRCPLDEVRNNIVREAQGKNCTHLIMMDTDQVYHPKTITRLLSRNLPVVGCKVHRRYPPFDPLMLSGRVNHYRTIEEWQAGEVKDVDATGTGCLLFQMNVFQKIPGPWFRFRKNRNPRTGGTIGEDIHFCSRLRRAGYKIFVDTSVPAGHLSTMIITEDTWKLYRAIKKAKERKGGRPVALTADYEGRSDKI